MAGSRLEKIGTIYSRASGLLKSGAMKWEDRPLWYDIYEAFPPKEEPCFGRPVPNIQLKQIFYEEDKIRAIFHRNNKRIGVTNFFNKNQKTLTDRFVETYQKIALQYGDEGNEEQIYKETIDLLKKDKDTVKENHIEDINLSSTFKESQDTKLNIRIEELLKEK